MSEEQPLIVRPSSKELDKILGKQFKVLNDGFIRVVDYMGTDSSIVQAARTSYGEGTKKTSEDRGLIRYLMRHRHSTPFEMCDIKLHVRVPMDTWRQWIRHRTASINEYSTRYSVAIDSMQKTDPHFWRSQAIINNQGSGDFLDPALGEALSQAEEDMHNSIRAEYESRLAKGVAREQARKDLPLSTYTEAYWKINLHNLMHFLALRTDSHAQLEIREYANVINDDIFRLWCPITYEAFTTYRKDAMYLTSIDKDIISLICAGHGDEAIKFATDSGFLNKDADGNLKRNRERAELEGKLKYLNISIPWEI